MCRAVTCSTCGRPTWAGCGEHIEEALRDVPVAERCQCQNQAPAPKNKARFGLFRSR